VAVDPQWLEELAGAASQQVDQDQRLDLQRLSRALSPRQQRLLWQAYGLGLGRRELTHELGRRADSLSRARQRAVARLRKLLAADPRA
jgi:DNA-directed RNA polymerase specialized sigma24 family protein